ncbi:hypothetical protein ACKAV7_005517 [Fusarium commune]
MHEPPPTLYNTQHLFFISALSSSSSSLTSFFSFFISHLLQFFPIQSSLSNTLHRFIDNGPTHQRWRKDEGHSGLQLAKERPERVGGCTSRSPSGYKGKEKTSRVSAIRTTAPITSQGLVPLRNVEKGLLISTTAFYELIDEIINDLQPGGGLNVDEATLKGLQTAAENHLDEMFQVASDKLWLWGLQDHHASLLRDISRTLQEEGFWSDKFMRLLALHKSDENNVADQTMHSEEDNAMPTKQEPKFEGSDDGARMN